MYFTQREINVLFLASAEVRTSMRIGDDSEDAGRQAQLLEFGLDLWDTQLYTGHVL
jgi:hypothetical protein